MKLFFKKGLVLAFLSLTFATGGLVGPAQVPLSSPTELSSLAKVAQQQKKAQEFREKSVLAKHLSNKYKVPKAEVREIVETAYREGTKNQVSPLLVLAIIEKESSFRIKVSNFYGAMGLMQVVPRFHAEKLADPTDHSELLSTQGNIRVGVQILAEYLDSKKGNLQKALKKYSGNAKEYYPKVMRYKTELRNVLDKENDRQLRPDWSRQPV